MLGLTKYLTAGLGIVVMFLAIALGIAMKSNAAKSERITTLEIAVQQSAQALAHRDKQISDLTATESRDTAQAAVQCATQGSDSYLRGVAVGKAIGARQCAA